MPIISILKPLREKLGEEGTDALVQVLNEKEARSSVIDIAEQRFEKRLTEEITSVRGELADAEKRFEKHLTEEISSLREEIVSLVVGIAPILVFPCNGEVSPSPQLEVVAISRRRPAAGGSRPAARRTACGRA